MNFLVDALAAFRLTRLALEDTFPPIERARSKLKQQVSADSWQRELMECPWCFGMYVAIVVVVVRRLAPRVWDPLANVLALSAAVGLITIRGEG